MKINTKPFENLLNTMQIPGGAYYSSDIVDVLSEAIKLAEAVNAMMPEQTELLPCLFCGNQPEIDEYQGEWRVSCYQEDSHSFCTTDYGSKEKAISKWNSRK